MSLSLAATSVYAQGEWETRWPLVGFTQNQEFDRNSQFNPDNTIYRFYDSAQQLELRPELRYSNGGFSLDLSPRLTLEREHGRSGGQSWTERSDWARLRYVRLQFASGQHSLRAGRYVNLWGPSVLLSPSNPFHLDSGQTSPQFELPARDYVEYSRTLDDRFNLGALVNIGPGDQTDEQFHRLSALKTDYTGDVLSQSLLLSWQSDRLAIGAYGQWTPSDSWVLYWDGEMRQGRILFAYPQGNHLGPDDSRDWNSSMLLGASYSFQDGTTLSLEGYHNGSGLSDDEREQVFELQRGALEALADPTKVAAAMQTLTAVAEIPFVRMGRNYAMLRGQRSNLWDRVDLSLLQVRNLDDDSRQTTLKIDWYANDSLQLFVYWSDFHGDAQSEYGRFIDCQLTMGFRWSVW